MTDNLVKSRIQPANPGDVARATASTCFLAPFSSNVAIKSRPVFCPAFFGDELLKLQTRYTFIVARYASPTWHFRAASNSKEYRTENPSSELHEWRQVFCPAFLVMNYWTHQQALRSFWLTTHANSDIVELLGIQQRAPYRETFVQPQQGLTWIDLQVACNFLLFCR